MPFEYADGEKRLNSPLVAPPQHDPSPDAKRQAGQAGPNSPLTAPTTAAKAAAKAADPTGATQRKPFDDLLSLYGIDGPAQLAGAPSTAQSPQAFKGPSGKTSPGGEVALATDKAGDNKVGPGAGTNGSGPAPAALSKGENGAKQGGAVKAAPKKGGGSPGTRVAGDESALGEAKQLGGEVDQILNAGGDGVANVTPGPVGADNKAGTPAKFAGVGGGGKKGAPKGKSGPTPDALVAALLPRFQANLGGQQQRLDQAEGSHNSALEAAISATDSKLQEAIAKAQAPLVEIRDGDKGILTRDGAGAQQDLIAKGDTHAEALVADSTQQAQGIEQSHTQQETMLQLRRDVWLLQVDNIAATSAAQARATAAARTKDNAQITDAEKQTITAQGEQRAKQALALAATRKGAIREALGKFRTLLQAEAKAAAQKMIAEAREGATRIRAQATAAGKKVLDEANAGIKQVDAAYDLIAGKLEDERKAMLAELKDYGDRSRKAIGEIVTPLRTELAALIGSAQPQLHAAVGSGGGAGKSKGQQLLRSLSGKAKQRVTTASRAIHKIGSGHRSGTQGYLATSTKAINTLAEDAKTAVGDAGGKAIDAFTNIQEQQNANIDKTAVKKADIAQRAQHFQAEAHKGFETVYARGAQMASSLEGAINTAWVDSALAGIKSVKKEGHDVLADPIAAMNTLNSLPPGAMGEAANRLSLPQLHSLANDVPPIRRREMKELSHTLTSPYGKLMIWTEVHKSEVVVDMMPSSVDDPDYFKKGEIIKSTHDELAAEGMDLLLDKMEIGKVDELIARKEYEHDLEKKYLVNITQQHYTLGTEAFKEKVNKKKGIEDTTAKWKLEELKQVDNALKRLKPEIARGYEIRRSHHDWDKYEKSGWEISKNTVGTHNKDEKLIQMHDRAFDHDKTPQRMEASQDSLAGLAGHPQQTKAEALLVHELAHAQHHQDQGGFDKFKQAAGWKPYKDQDELTDKLEASHGEETAERTASRLEKTRGRSFENRNVENVGGQNYITDAYTDEGYFSVSDAAMPGKGDYSYAGTNPKEHYAELKAMAHLTPTDLHKDLVSEPEQKAKLARQALQREERELKKAKGSGDAEKIRKAGDAVDAEKANVAKAERIEKTQKDVWESVREIDKPKIDAARARLSAKMPQDATKAAKAQKVMQQFENDAGKIMTDYQLKELEQRTAQQLGSL